ncbi:hypothetical protein KM043_009282 [Ampulex compressa]|nr:hypothetical protein KM043_009282 [Ampulex compressa]
MNRWFSKEEYWFDPNPPPLARVFVRPALDPHLGTRPLGEFLGGGAGLKCVGQWREDFLAPGLWTLGFGDGRSAWVILEVRSFLRGWEDEDCGARVDLGKVCCVLEMVRGVGVPLPNSPSQALSRQVAYLSGIKAPPQEAPPRPGVSAN